MNNFKLNYRLNTSCKKASSRKEKHVGKKGKFQDFDTTHLRILPGFIEAYVRNKTSLLTENKDVRYLWCISIKSLNFIDYEIAICISICLLVIFLEIFLGRNLLFSSDFERGLSSKNCRPRNLKKCLKLRAIFPNQFTFKR